MAMYRGVVLVSNLLQKSLVGCNAIQLRNLRGKAPEVARTLKQRLEGI